MTHSTLNTHEKSWQHDGKTKYITGYCDTNVHDTVPLPLMLLVMMNAQMVIDAAHDDDDVDARAVAAGVHDGGERENHLPLINPEEGLRGFGERQHKEIVPTTPYRDGEDDALIVYDGSAVGGEAQCTAPPGPVLVKDTEPRGVLPCQ